MYAAHAAHEFLHSDDFRMFVFLYSASLPFPSIIPLSLRTSSEPREHPVKSRSRLFRIRQFVTRGNARRDGPGERF